MSLGAILRLARPEEWPVGRTAVPVGDILNRTSEGARLSLDDVRELLSVLPSENPAAYGSIMRTSETLKRRLFRGRVFAIVPIYVSSICQEHCIYCNYRAGNKHREITRLRLNDGQLQLELEFLVRKGFRALELVYATDPLVSVADIARHVRLARDVLAGVGGGLVGLNARPYTIGEYIELKAAGLDFAVLWQETYDSDAYRRVHPGRTEKTDFLFRLGAQERMIEAGIEHVGLGVLSGLSNWRTDWIRLMRHVEYLRSRWAEQLKTVILGLPRLKSAAGALLRESPCTPTDSEQLLAVATFNLFDRFALPFVNTRERWGQCVAMAAGGGTLFTLNCKTIPGGYTQAQAGYQFPTYDYGEKAYLRELEARGITPIFDWSFESLPRATRLIESGVLCP